HRQAVVVRIRAALDVAAGAVVSARPHAEARLAGAVAGGVAADGAVARGAEAAETFVGGVAGLAVGEARLAGVVFRIAEVRGDAVAVVLAAGAAGRAGAVAGVGIAGGGVARGAGAGAVAGGLGHRLAGRAGGGATDGA